MEVQCGRQAVVAACRTAAAGLLNQDALDPPAAIGDPLLAAQNTPVRPASVQPEDRTPMPRADPHDLARSGGGVNPCAARVRPRDFPAPEPIADRCDRSVQSRRDLFQRCTLSCELLESGSVRCSARGVLGHEHMFVRAPDGPPGQRGCGAAHGSDSSQNVNETRTSRFEVRSNQPKLTFSGASLTTSWLRSLRSVRVSRGSRPAGAVFVKGLDAITPLFANFCAIRRAPRPRRRPRERRRCGLPSRAAPRRAGGSRAPPAGGAPPAARPAAS